MNFCKYKSFGRPKVSFRHEISISKLAQLLVVLCPSITLREMGNQQASFSNEQIEQYQDCTFFTKKEIIKLHSRFRELNPEVVPMNMQTEEG